MFFNRLNKKSDEELVRMIQEGKSAALTVLYKRYSTLMVRYFYRMLWKDENKAQDFLQDLFIKILESPGIINTDRRFATWLYSVANNMCKNEYRKQAFRDAVHDSKSYEVIPERLTDTDLTKHEFFEALDRSIQSLEEEDKNLYTLRFELDMPLQEIAIALNCPVGTVKSRIFNLKKKLAEQLRVYDPVNE